MHNSMHEKNKKYYEVIELLKGRFKNYSLSMAIPPPVFTEMSGDIIDYSLENGTMIIEFPLYRKYANPFGNMQGGMVTAAIDNTLGPLSMLVAPPNYTRELKIKYKKPIHIDDNKITVTGTYLKRNGRQLYFTASVKDVTNIELATAESFHWIIS